VKPKIADLERTMDYRIMQKHELHPLLRLARAAKDYSDALRIGVRQGDFIPPLRAAINAFDWGDE
jgi:hypothetical protein